MRRRVDERGFVLSGTALLLVLPAMILTSSLFSVAMMGGETVALQSISDKVFYTGKDIKRMIENIWQDNVLFDNENNANLDFAYMADNYNSVSGLIVDITPTWLFWIYVEETGENHRAGTTYGKTQRLRDNEWRYWFEDYFDGDYNDPTLVVTENAGQMYVRLESFSGGFHVDVYYDTTKMWDNITGEDNHEASERSSMVFGSLTQLKVDVQVTDTTSSAKEVFTENLG